MTTISKSLLAFAVVGALAGLIAFFNVSPFRTAVENTFGASPAGTTSQTAKYFSVVANLGLPGANATSSSVLNSSANDLYVTSFKVGCEALGTSRTAYTGTGLVGLTVTAATSSTASPASNSNTNSAGLITIGTSTPNFVESSSTASTGSNSVNYIWSAGSYMTFTTNATNTAACTFGVEAFSS